MQLLADIDRQEALALWGKASALDLRRMRQRLEDRLTGRDIPNPGAVIQAAADHLAAIRAELGRVHETVVEPKLGQHGRKAEHGGEPAAVDVLPCRNAVLEAQTFGEPEESSEV